MWRGSSKVTSVGKMRNFCLFVLLDGLGLKLNQGCNIACAPQPQPVLLCEVCPPLPPQTISISFANGFHDGAEMPINCTAISTRASPICISQPGSFPEHHLQHMNYYPNITAVSTFLSIQLPIIIFLADNPEILNSSILLK